MKRRALDSTVLRALEAVGEGSVGSTLVVGLSGGADSVALTDSLASLSKRQGFRLVAAHLDHGLRPDSAEDAAFCARLCRDLGVEFRRGRADVRGRAARDKRGLEDAGRRERYAFLRRVMEEEGARAIAVAHTRDDQAETLLLRLVRGAGSTGLAAMRARCREVVRPLLHVSRDEVRRHLHARGLLWREDPTNADPAFLRNRVRHELVPLLEQRFNPKVRAALARTASLLADEAKVMGRKARRLWSRIGAARGGVAVLRREELRRCPLALARLVLRRALREAGGLRGVSAHHVERLLDLARAKNGSGRRWPLPGGREAQVVFSELRIGPKVRQWPAFALPLPVPGRVELPDGNAILAEASAGPAVSNGATAVVAAPAGEAGLIVRTRRPGDHVLYHGREVSLKRFLMARRIAAASRASLPLVAAGSQVLFVPGEAVDPRPGRKYVKLSLVEGRPA